MCQMPIACNVYISVISHFREMLKQLSFERKTLLQAHKNEPRPWDTEKLVILDNSKTRIL